MSTSPAKVVITADATTFVRHLENARELLARFERVWLTHWYTGGRVRRRNGPRPLPIDGHEYHRRTRARRRRAR